MLANNLWLEPPNLKRPLQWGQGQYWDTTVARKHPYWKEVALPQPTKNIIQLRADFLQWGYCLIEDALSTEQWASGPLVGPSGGRTTKGIDQQTPTGSTLIP